MSIYLFIYLFIYSFIYSFIHCILKGSCLLQLPPTLSPNPQRRIVEQFKRALFAPHNSSFVNLKSEVKKVWILNNAGHAGTVNSHFADTPLRRFI